MPGLTDQGFVARRQPEIQAAIEARLAGDEVVGGFNFRAGPLQQLIGVLSELLAEQWESMEATYASQYRTAAGVSLDRVSALTGTTRREATRSTVTATVTLDAGATLLVGSIGAVLDVPDSQFRSTVVATNSGPSSDTFPVLFEGVKTGPVAAPAGTLTVIVTAVAGWAAITNGADADLGLLISDDPELRTKRETELQGSGSANIDAINAAVSLVDGVISSRTYQNVTSMAALGRPPKSIEVVLFDGVALAADDDEVAQAIWDEIGAGIEPFGTGSSGAATDDTGVITTIPFTRATVIPLFVDVTVVLTPGTLIGDVSADVAAAIAARGEEYVVGEDVFASQPTCDVQELALIEAVSILTVGTAPSPVSTFVAIGEQEIADIPVGNVTVTGA